VLELTNPTKLKLGLIRYRCYENQNLPLMNVTIHLKSEIQLTLNPTLINIGSKYTTVEQFPDIHFNFPTDHCSRIEIKGKIIYRCDNSLTNVEKNLLLYSRLVKQGVIKNV
jgi:hypothetical protein